MNTKSVPSAAVEQAVLSELDQLHAQLAALKDQLTDSQRLATIGTIAATIAHEFNNILTPVVSYAQFAMESADSEKPDLALIRKALTKAYSGSTKAGRICNSMLGLVRGESNIGDVAVQHLVDEVLLVLARDPKKDGIALRVQVQPGLHVLGDCVQLEQVLLNLLINARHAMLARGGSLTIKAVACDEPWGAAGTGDAKSGGVKIQVSDTGAGIPEKLIGKIFQPFFTTKSAGRPGETRGTGLGLSICKEIIDHHGGLIEVQSEVGKGTTFTLTLPAANTPPALRAIA